MKIGSLFSGIGGLERGVEMAVPGVNIVWQAEMDPNARAVLASHWPAVRCYNDVKEIDETAERPDIICGGFPCQDISLAGAGAGITGPKSGLWAEFARIVGVLRPNLVFVENVAAILGRGLDRVLRDLAALGYDAEWETFLASDVGAPHRRDRLFLLAYADRERVRELAERDQRGGWGERAAERGDAEPVHDRAQLADANGEVGRHAPGISIGGDGPQEAGAGKAEPRRFGGGSISDAERQGREGMRGGELPGPRGTDAAELRARPLADSMRSGQRAGERDIRAGQPDTDGRGEGYMADAAGYRSGRLPAGSGRADASLVDGCGQGIQSRGRPHRFPPGPADHRIGWDGPQPAIRRGDDGVPGRSHRLRLLGNAVVPQQAALAFRALIARAAV